MSNQEGIVFIKDTEKVFVTVHQSGIPPGFLEKEEEDEESLLNPVSFGTEDIKNQPILYLDVDSVIDFYNLEFEKMTKDPDSPEGLTEKLLGNFFLFRKVKKEVIEKETVK
jgi:hypothetical protein